MYRLVIDWGLLEQIIFLPSCLAFLSVLLTSHLQQKKLPGTRSKLVEHWLARLQPGHYVPNLKTVRTRRPEDLRQRQRGAAGEAA